MIEQLLAEMTAKIDVINNNIDALETSKSSVVKSTEEEIQSIIDGRDKLVATADEEILRYRDEVSAINLSLEAVKKVSSYYEQKIKEAADGIYEASTTGGVNEGDVATFFDKIGIDLPGQVEQPPAQEETAESEEAA